MKQGWQKKTLADVCQIRPPKSEARIRVAPDAFVSFVPMEELGIDRKFLIPKQRKPLASVIKGYTYFVDGDVLLAKITPCFENGKLGIASGLSNGIGFGSTEFFVFRPGSSVDREYLYYYLSRADFRDEGAERMGGAVGQQRVPKEFIENYPIPVPPLPEQQRVVGILDEAFAGIAVAKSNADKNLRNARALFESHLQSVFTQRGKGWPKKQLGDICDFEGGSQPPKAKFNYTPKAGYVRFLQIRDFGSEKNVTYIPDSRKNRLCREEDILIGRYGASVGKILTGKAGAYNVALMKTIPDLTVLDRSYFYHYLISGAFQERLMNVAARSAQNGFSKEDISGFPVPVPPTHEQKEIIGRTELVVDNIQRLESIYHQKHAALDALKRSLLHQAFSGEL